MFHDRRRLGAIQPRAVIAAGYTAFPVRFENNNQINHNILTRGAALTSVVNTKVGILSFWFRFTDTSMDSQNIIWLEDGSSGLVLQVAKLSTNTLRINGANGATLQMLSTTTFTSAMTGWAHLLAAWDVSAAAGAGTRQLYINNVSDIGTNSSSNNAIAYAGETNWGVGGRAAGTTSTSMDVADFYLNTDAFLDMSNSANRAKFIDQGTLKPVSLGSNGSTPTGAQPVICFNAQSIPAWPTNNGYGGGFTLGGSVAVLTQAPTGP